MEGINSGPKYIEDGQAVETNVEEVLQATKSHIEKILFDLKDKIESGEFEVVLGVDSSGRVPALMLAESIKHLTPIQIKFISGSRNVRQEDRSSESEKLVTYFSSPTFSSTTLKKKILIVDDTLHSGSALELICSALKSIGIKYEIAVLTSVNSFTDEEGILNEYVESKPNIYNEYKLGGPITNSVSDSGPASIYGKGQMSGVTKSATIFSTPLEKPISRYKNNIPAYGEETEPKQNREVLEYTRRRIHEISSEIASDLGWLQ